MRTVFFGATKFSEEILRHLVNNGVEINAVFTIPEKFGISYSQAKVRNYNYADLASLAQDLNIPCYFVDSSGEGTKTADYKEVLAGLKPDVILVMGWYYMVNKSIRELATYGAWGIHASMLPDYAGGAPLVWAIINGEKETGVTLFRLDDGVDDGDIIAQEKIDIGPDENIREVYEKVTRSSMDMVLKVLKSNPSEIVFRPQDKTKIKVFPQRCPDDGELDFSQPAKQLYDFIRAQSSPYPGAFFRTSDGKKLIIEKARIEE